MADKTTSAKNIRDNFSPDLLFWAAREGNNEKITSLLGSTTPEPLLRSIDVNQSNSDGYTPLMMAAAHGHTKSCAILLQHGADVMRVDRYGRTAIDKAERYQHVDTVAFLRAFAKEETQRKVH